MFMKFTLFSNHHQDGFEGPVGYDGDRPQQKICINLKKIETIQQSGRWEEIPVEPRPEEVQAQMAQQQFGAPPDFLGGINQDPWAVAQPVRPNRPRARQRRREVFVLNADRFFIYMQNGQQYEVMGNFDDFCETLSNFRNKLETV